jgi:pyruvate carboxylase subunit B
MGDDMNMQTTIFSSPLPGKVVKILAREGELVEQGQGVFVMESMKMLHTLQAAKRGYMRQMMVQEGEIVSAHRQLACVV